MAPVPYSMSAGKRMIEETISECVGPLCASPGISKSKSGSIESRKRRAALVFTFRSLDVAFPVKYPKARCPTANVENPSTNEENRGYTS